MKTIIFLSMVVLCSAFSVLGLYNKARALKLAEKKHTVESAGDAVSE